MFDPPDSRDCMARATGPGGLFSHYAKSCEWKGVRSRQAARIERCPWLDEIVLVEGVVRSARIQAAAFHEGCRAPCLRQIPIPDQIGKVAGCRTQDVGPGHGLLDRQVVVSASLVGRITCGIRTSGRSSRGVKCFTCAGTEPMTGPGLWPPAPPPGGCRPNPTTPSSPSVRGRSRCARRCKAVNVTLIRRCRRARDPTRPRHSPDSRTPRRCQSPLPALQAHGLREKCGRPSLLPQS